MNGEKLINEKASQKRSEEFFSPIPEGYEKGKTKYIFVAGSVMSGIGKGIFSSSLAKLLTYSGINVEPIKMDGYLNQDAGTLNPFRHGEVFVLDDGLECDMDLGSYERFLDKDLGKENYMTAGMIFSDVLRKERKGEYLGRDVQFIPHVTAETKQRIRNLAVKRKPDVIIVEVGGTIGDFENMHFIEAIREFMYEEGKENACFINLVYILEPPNLGEQKSKPAQLGLNRLMSFGIQPDFVVCRSVRPVEQKIKEKISVYSNVPTDNVISLHNTSSVYGAPVILEESGVDLQVMNRLGITHKADFEKKKIRLDKWKEFRKKYLNAEKKIKIGLCGKYTGLNDSYASVLKAVEHSATHYNAKAEIKFIDTTTITSKNVKEQLDGLKGIIVPGGFGERGVEGKIECIKYARENNMPFLGLCYGFQMAVIEFARNVLGVKEATTTEICESAEHPLICILPEQMDIEDLGGSMRLGGYDLFLKENSKAAEIYGSTAIRRRFRHRYNVNPEYIEKIEEQGMVFSGNAPEKRIMQVLELQNHPFFMATQYHPELTSRPLKPEPLFREFIGSALSKE